MKMLALLLFFPLCVFAEEYSARVVSVHDGDTIVILHQGRAETVRLKGIDCSETSSRSRNYASDALKGKNVKLKTYGKDKLKRTIADVFLESGRLFNRDLVRTRHCRWKSQQLVTESTE